MLTLFALVDFLSLREEEDVDGYFGARPTKTPRHRAEPDYTIAFIDDLDERLDISEPRRVSLLQRFRALLFR